MICESINTRDVVSPPVVGVSTWLGADQTLDQQSGEIHGIEGKHCLSWASPRLPVDVTTMNAAANNSASVMIHLPVFLLIAFDFFLSVYKCKSIWLWVYILSRSPARVAVSGAGSPPTSGSGRVTITPHTGAFLISEALTIEESGHALRAPRNVTRP